MIVRDRHLILSARDQQICHLLPSGKLKYDQYSYYNVIFTTFHNFPWHFLGFSDSQEPWRLSPSLAVMSRSEIKLKTMAPLDVSRSTIAKSWEFPDKSWKNGTVSFHRETFMVWWFRDPSTPSMWQAACVWAWVAVGVAPKFLWWSESAYVLGVILPFHFWHQRNIQFEAGVTRNVLNHRETSHESPNNRA